MLIKHPPPPRPRHVDTGKNNENFFFLFFTMSIRRCHEKIVQNSIFASFQGDLACIWPETYPAKYTSFWTTWRFS